MRTYVDYNLQLLWFAHYFDVDNQKNKLSTRDFNKNLKELK